jgi:imidazolonepropionase-like amidohydrolase
MTMKKLLYSLPLVAALLLSAGLHAQVAKGRTGTFALTNATIETITKGKIEKGTLVIQDGKIAALGTNVSIPQGAEVIDCSGMTIYPGMIDSGTRLGLTEVNSVSLTVDHNEVGNINPHMRALTAINPNSVLIPVTRVSGVTTTLSLPSSGLIPGTAALINLHGYTPDQMYAGFEGVVLNFPTTGRRGRWDRRTDDELKKAADKALKELNDIWAKAVQYHQLDSALKASKSSQTAGFYPEMQALMPVVRGERPLIIEVNAAKDIEKALEWVEGKKVKVILSGVSEGWRVADKIAKANVPVLAAPTLSIPTREYDRYDKAYANPGLMAKAGVKVALTSGQAENVRNLPYNAGFAAAYGWSKEAALKAITIVPAEIFGVQDRLGSLEVGKEATLFIATGDPFETKTAVKRVFIAGWEIPMDSRHIQLYDEFLDRAPGVKK